MNILRLNLPMQVGNLEIEKTFPWVFLNESLKVNLDLYKVWGVHLLDQGSQLYLQSIAGKWV